MNETRSSYDLIFLIAMDYEIEHIFDLNHWQKKDQTTFTTYSHISKAVALVETGVGKVNAAAAAEYALGLNAKKYVNLGLVGSFDRDMAIGSASVIKECKFWDIDVTALDFKKGQIPFNGLESYKLASSELVSSVTNCISGDSFVQDPSSIEGFAQDFSASFLEMEVTALAHIFHLHGKLDDLVSIKAISDYLNKDSAEDFYDQKKSQFDELKKISHKYIEMC